MKQPTKKDEEKAANRASKPPGHSRHMSGKQILDICEGKARVKLRHHQPIPNQYGTWWGHGSEIRGYGLVMGRGEETYFAVFAQALLGNTSCWDGKPSKRGKVERGTVRYMP